MAEFIESVPEVWADGGMVYAKCGDRARYCMSPHMALVLAGALRKAAYEIMDGGLKPVPVRKRADH